MYMHLFKTVPKLVEVVYNGFFFYSKTETWRSICLSQSWLREDCF